MVFKRKLITDFDFSKIKTTYGNYSVSNGMYEDTNIQKFIILVNLNWISSYIKPIYYLKEKENSFSIHFSNGENNLCGMITAAICCF